ncbi:MAG: membrane-bound lytic murein transglycosylase [Cryomorphaceae bacterium]|jgi:membrane-bound lytic murein transglycosylase
MSKAQGSGFILLTDGSTVAVGYARKNGHPYQPIGRVLIPFEIITKLLSVFGSKLNITSID